MFTRKAPAGEQVDIAELRNNSAAAHTERNRERAKEQHEQRLRDIGWDKRR